ncbi:MAG TPA: macro domain-containing protein [Candidatus Binatia bacterium]|nr:macro domain-containing protein [Candidatus Binatia bacterium]
MVELKRGNLLGTQADALVNTVNTEGVMGKGIALQFKKAFPANYDAYRRECESGHIQIGKVFVYELGALLPRYIFNFPTKKSWRHPSKVEYIRAGLSDLVKEVRRLHIRSIAIPPLGCGNGGLEWSKVRPLIEQAFADLRDVRVILFEPAGAPKAAAMTNRTRRPRMTAGRAAVIALMNRYLVPGYDYPLSLLEVQKLAYFLQVAGQPLRLQYMPHLYGPYADNLRHVLNHIEGHFTEGFGDGRNAPETPLRLLPGAAEEAGHFLRRDTETEDRLQRVARLIEGFETPLGMELLATVHWVMTHEAADAPDLESIVRSVHAWSSRKAASMKSAQIHAAYDRLRTQGWGRHVGARLQAPRGV